MVENTHNRILTAEEFGRIFKKCRPIYINIANSYIHDSDIAEDIVCESFIKMWEKRDEIQTDNFEAYAFKIIVNKCLDTLKIQHARIRIQQDIHSTGNRLQMYEINSLKSLNPDKLFANEIMELIKECLDKLPEDTRRIFLASRIDEKTYAQIAEETGKPIRQVTTHIQSALKALRTYLKDYLPSIAIAMLLASNGLLSIQKDKFYEAITPTHTKSSIITP